MKPMRLRMLLRMLLRRSEMLRIAAVRVQRRLCLWLLLLLSVCRPDLVEWRYRVRLRVRCVPVESVRRHAARVICHGHGRVARARRHTRLLRREGTGVHAALVRLHGVHVLLLLELNLKSLRLQLGLLLLQLSGQLRLQRLQLREVRGGHGGRLAGLRLRRRLWLLLRWLLLLLLLLRLLLCLLLLLEWRGRGRVERLLSRVCVAVDVVLHAVVVWRR